ncbi:MAG TPA: bifunctional precorrin-2 dehydrogenase/sirohydrochlorin ferrochelatase [Terriglobales bacterium]|nr:bifunctional precorrin-2 dehydrogenase/sirohydrochlorin ferrochelatase [Terriglobales bacterium]
MSLFPMFLKLEGRSCLVVGADTIGQSKIRSLLVAGASVRVVAPRATAAIIEWARAGLITWEARDFNAADLDGTFLVVAATSSSDVNEATFREAQRRGVLCNVVDDPAHCDFYYPALVRRGQLQLAISTGGRSPALAQRLRRELEAKFGAEYAGWLEELGRAREQLFGSEIESEDRRRRLHELASRQAFEALQPRSQAKGEIHDG